MVEQHVHHPLTAAQIDRYHDDGFIIVSQLFGEDEALACKQQTIDALRELKELGNPSGVHVWMSDGLDPNLRRWVTDERIAGIVEQLVGPHIEFLSVKSVFKNRDLRFASPWHQDWFYWRGANKISAWLALDDATVENGCLRFVPGTHRQVYEMVQVDEGHGFVLRVPEEAFRGQTPVSVALKRGDVAFFHDLALHGSHENKSGTDRWSLIATYREGSVKDDSDVWKRSITLCGHSVNH